MGMFRQVDRFHYVIRRALYAGKVTSQNLVDDLKMGSTAASELLRGVAQDPLVGKLFKRKRGQIYTANFPDLGPRGSQLIEKFGPLTQLLLMLKDPENAVLHGIHGNEQDILLITEPQKSKLLIDQDAALALLGALRYQRPIDIRYVSMRQNATSAWRPIVPAALNRTPIGIWNLRAHCLNTPGSPLKSFALTRLLDCRSSYHDLPKGFRRATGDETTMRYKVIFNNRVSREQREVLVSEMGLEVVTINPGSTDYFVRLKESALYSFKMLYLAKPPEGALSEDSIWPPIQSLLEC